VLKVLQQHCVMHIFSPSADDCYPTVLELKLIYEVKYVKCNVYTETIQMVWIIIRKGIYIYVTHNMVLPRSEGTQSGARGNAITVTGTEMWRRSIRRNGTAW